jgi:hypothetical protein
MMDSRAGAICLNVGCGVSVAPDWLNVDGSFSLRLGRLPLVGPMLARAVGGPAWPPSVVYGDVVRGLGLPESSCALVFASHVLEHLSEADCRTALGHLYRYLRPGGVLRCIVPDLEVQAREYLRRLSGSDRAVAERAAGEFLAATSLGLHEARTRPRARLREAFANSRHQWMWDRPSLERVLREVGFRDVQFRKYGDWADERFGQVEEESRHVDSLCAEARKPDRDGLGPSVER